MATVIMLMFPGTYAFGQADNPAAGAAQTREKAPPEVGYGEKDEKQILLEEERAPRIGVLAPLTGELEQYGLEASNGAELASDEIEDKGGIRNKSFELLVFDTKGKIVGARLGVDAFLSHDVLAVVGAATGEVSFSANRTINENQLIMISAGSRRRLGDTGPYNFRNTLDDPKGVKDLFDYIEKNKKWRNFAVFSSLVNDYSVRLTALFKGEVLNRNLNLTHELYLWSQAMTHISSEETSIPAQIGKLKENTPDALIYTGDAGEAGELIKEMRRQGINIPLIGSEDLMNPKFVALGKSAEGTLVYSGFNVESNNPKVKRFVARYTKRFSKPPTRLAALSYDAYYMLAEAIERAKSMRPSHVRQALLSIKDFEGVTGRTSVSPSGEAVKNAYIFELKKSDGGYDFVCVKEPE